MTDRYDHDLLLGYLEGDLEAADRARVERLLADDPALAELMRDMAGDRDRLRAMPMEPTPGDLSFDLVQGLERRMLLDAPEVEPSGPIPIQRGQGLSPPASGVRWGRAMGLGGMAAAVALAAGLVVFVATQDPLTRTAQEMANDPTTMNAPTGEAQPNDVTARSGQDMNAAGGATPRDDDNARMRSAPANTPPRNHLAELAREALTNGHRGGRSEAPGGADAGTAALGAPRGGGGTGGPGGFAEAGNAAADMPPTGNVIALSALPPDRALQIESDDPGLTRQQVLNWAVDNRVPVVEPQLAKSVEAAALGDEPIALLIEEDQLEELVSVMNSVQVQNVRQQAQVSEPAAAYQAQAPVQPLAQEVEAGALADRDAGDNTDAEPQDAAGQDPTPAPQAVVELRVPEDLGDEAQTRQNFANTLEYSRQEERALAAQRDAEVARNQRRATDPGTAPGSPEAMADALVEGDAPGGTAGEGQDTQAPSEAENDAGGRSGGLGPAEEEMQEPGGRGRGHSRGGPSRDGGRRGDPPPPTQDAPDAGNDSDDPGAAGPGGNNDAGGDRPTDGDPTMREQAEDQERATDEGAPEGAPVRDTDEAPDDLALDAETEADDVSEQTPPRPRGNWLLPQLPLAETTPIWTDPPASRLVPVIIVRRALRPADEQAEPDREALQTPPPPAETGDAAGDPPPADDEAPAEGE